MDEKKKDDLEISSLTKCSIISLYKNNVEGVRSVNFMVQVIGIKGLNDDCNDVELTLSDGLYFADKFYLLKFFFKHHLELFDILNIKRIKRSDIRGENKKVQKVIFKITLYTLVRKCDKKIGDPQKFEYKYEDEEEEEYDKEEKDKTQTINQSVIMENEHKNITNINNNIESEIKVPRPIKKIRILKTKSDIKNEEITENSNYKVNNLPSEDPAVDIDTNNNIKQSSQIEKEEQKNLNDSKIKYTFQIYKSKEKKESRVLQNTSPPKIAGKQSAPVILTSNNFNNSNSNDINTNTNQYHENININFDNFNKNFQKNDSSSLNISATKPISTSKLNWYPRPFSTLPKSDINTSFCVLGRVVDIYTIPPYILHVIIKDEADETALLHINSSLKWKFEDQLKLDRLYYFHDGEVRHDKFYRLYRRINYEIKLIIGSLAIEESNDKINSFNNTYLTDMIKSELTERLHKLDELQSLYIDNQFLIDVLVYVIEIAEAKSSPIFSPHIMDSLLTIKIADTSMLSIEATISKTNLRMKIDNFKPGSIVLIKNAVIKYDEISRAYSLIGAIHTSIFDASDFNYLKAVKDTKECFLNNYDIMVKNFLHPHNLRYAGHEGLKHRPIKYVKQEISFFNAPYNILKYSMIKGKIVNFKNSESHVYNACPLCKKALLQKNIVFLCENCSKTHYSINYAFCLKIHVLDSDGGGNESMIDLVIFDTYSHKLLKDMTAETYLRKIDDKSKSMKIELVEIEQGINGREFLFLIRPKITPDRQVKIAILHMEEV